MCIRDRTRTFEDPGYDYDPEDVQNSGYTPINTNNTDDAMDELLKQVDLTRDGWKVTEATHPHFSDAKTVANDCGIPYVEGSDFFTLGCTYPVNGGSAISVVEPTSNVWKATGGNPKITLIHEMLHFVYSNYVPVDAQSKIYSELVDQEPGIFNQLKKLGYSEEQFDDEMFVRVGSEKITAPEDVATIYAKYFNIWATRIVKKKTPVVPPNNSPDDPKNKTPKPAPESNLTHTNSNYKKLQKCHVRRVVDGDTLYVDCLSVRIRLLGVDTPETVNPSKPIECYGEEASDYTKKLSGKDVYIEEDFGNRSTDTYGRPLRYVYTEDGSNLNVELIIKGFGKYVPQYGPYKYASQLKKAEDTAKKDGTGLWNKDICNGLS